MNEKFNKPEQPQEPAVEVLKIKITVDKSTPEEFHKKLEEYDEELEANYDGLEEWINDVVHEIEYEESRMEEKIMKEFGS